MLLLLPLLVPSEGLLAPMYFQRIVLRILTGIGISKIAQSAVMSSHEVPLLMALVLFTMFCGRIVIFLAVFPCPSGLSTCRAGEA